MHDQAWAEVSRPARSIACKTPKYLFKVGHGLEDTGKPFLWVVKKSEVAAWKRAEP
uniref:Uncharacterized protein n=1 Tax=Oryza sativa subsp. japonica TaxID=39947 RepID=Q6H8F5_ORYSJ|nr:hypothetical protein [Oryza sativa Japonica Group]